MAGIPQHILATVSYKPAKTVTSIPHSLRAEDSGSVLADSAFQTL